MKNPFRRGARPGNVTAFEIEQELDKTRKELATETKRADHAEAQCDVWKARADRFSNQITDLTRRLRDTTDQKLAHELADMKALALAQENQLAKDRDEIEDLERRLAQAIAAKDTDETPVAAA